MNLQEVACELSKRLAGIFLPDANGRSAWHGEMSVFASDPRWRDAASIAFLTYTLDLLTEQGWRIGNVDATIVAERPRMTPHIPAIRARLAEALGFWT